VNSSHWVWVVRDYNHFLFSCHGAIMDVSDAIVCGNTFHLETDLNATQVPLCLLLNCCMKRATSGVFNVVNGDKVAL